MGAIRGVPVTQFLALKDPATGVDVTYYLPGEGN